MERGVSLGHCHEQPDRERQHRRRRVKTLAHATAWLKLFVSQIVCKIASAMPDTSGLWTFCPSNANQRRAKDAGGIAELMFDYGRFQFVSENIFPHRLDAFSIDGGKIRDPAADDHGVGVEDVNQVRHRAAKMVEECLHELQRLRVAFK